MLSKVLLTYRQVSNIIDKGHVMNADGSFILDVLLLAIGLHFILYLIYGRVTGRPLIAPPLGKTPGHRTFLKLVNNTRYLIISIFVTIFFALSTTFDVLRILDSSSPRSILIIVP